jgi:heme-degrading monooxygenase HmoA
MFIAMNRFKVIKGAGSDFEQAARFDALRKGS